MPKATGVVLVGSSLGGFVAVHVAQRRPDRVVRLILLAPAFAFGGTNSRSLGDRDLDQWKTTGTTNVFHYGYGRMLPVGYALYADACGYDCADAGAHDADPDLPGAERCGRGPCFGGNMGRESAQR